MPIWNLGIILKIVIKINVLPASPLAIVVCLVPIALKRILVRILIPLGIGAPIILLIITLRWKKRLLLLLLVFKLLSSSFLLLIE